MEAIRLAEVMRGTLLLNNDPLVRAHIALEQALPAVCGRRVLPEQVLTKSRRRLRVSARAAAGQVILRVTDSGPGIAAAVMHRLFDPFFTTKPSGKGTGLGLAICQGILNECGGAISAGNAGDGGAVLILILPCRQPAVLRQDDNARCLA